MKEDFDRVVRVLNLCTITFDVLIKKGVYKKDSQFAELNKELKLFTRNMIKKHKVKIFKGSKIK